MSEPTAEERARERLSERIIQCVVCGKQRHAPRVAEAFHGWERLGPRVWMCPDCGADALAEARAAQARAGDEGA